MTVGEAQARMTFGEFTLWLRYIRKNGPFNDRRRFDRPAALVAALVGRANGSRATLQDYMPKFGRDAADGDDAAQSFDDLVRVMKGGNHA